MRPRKHGMTQTLKIHFITSNFCSLHLKPQLPLLLSSSLSSSSFHHLPYPLYLSSMDAIYSPSTQTFALIPRSSTSSSSSSSSSPSVRLSLTKIQSVRHEFLLGCDNKLRFRTPRNCAWRLPPHTSSRNRSLRLVASLNSLSIAAVVVAMTMSAAAAAYSRFHYSRRKKDFDEAPGPPESEHGQEARETNKQGIFTPVNGEHLLAETLENNNSLQEVTDGSPEDKGSVVKLLCQDHSTLAEDKPNTEQSNLPDSSLSHLGAFASALSEKSEKVGIAFPQESSELISIQSIPNCTELSEFADGGREIILDLASASMIEKNDAMFGVAETVPVKDDSSEESNDEHDECQNMAFTSNETIKAGREELYLFYEDTSMSDYPGDVRLISGLNAESSLNVSTTTKNSASKILSTSHFPSTGTNGHISITSHIGHSLHERKDSFRGRGSPRSDARALSFRHSHQKSSDVPDTYEMKPSVTSQMSSYNSLLRSGRLRECVELLEDMDKNDMLDMSKIYHTKFFDLCRSQKMVKEAFRFAKLITNPTLSTFNMLMSVCSSAQDSEGAFDAWRLVLKAGFKADCKLYTTLISTCAKSGKVDTMFEVFHDMVNCGVVPNVHTYGALIDGCARASQVAKAFGAYGILRSKNVKPDRVVFNALISACGQSGAVERAFDVLAEMRAEAQPIDPDHVTIGALIRACTSAGQVDRVKGVYEMIDKYNIKGTPELYTIAVNSCSQTGDWEFACKIYDMMKNKGVVPDEMFFSALIDVTGHAGNLDAAFDVLRDARSQGMNPGIISYSSLMGACSKTQNWEKALELFDEIKSLKLHFTVSTINALITTLCDGGQMQKAQDMLSEMKKLGLCPNNVTYSILLMGSEKNDDLEVGLTLFSQAKEDSVPFSLIMCKCLIRMCLRRFENASTIGEPVTSSSGRPQIDSKWTSLALTVYREVIKSGLIPSVEMLAQVLGCLQLPQDAVLKKRLTETLGINTEKLRNPNLLPLIDGFGEYDPRAFSLFEEAASLGIVPGVHFKRNPIFIDASNILSTHIAKVYILTVLKGLKHRLAAGARLPSISILLPVEMAQISRPKGDRTINISARVSQAVGALLRRLRLSYQGSESHGKIKITGLALKRWLQPKIIPSFDHNEKQAQVGLSQLRLANGITNQQRDIRTGNLSLY